MIITKAASFTRPNNTTAYASGQLVANAVSNVAVVPMSFAFNQTNGQGIALARARLNKSGVVITNASFRAHLYGPGVSLNVITNGDGGAWLTSGSAFYLGYFDIATMLAFSDGANGAGVPAVGAALRSYAGTMYALLEARGAYTPAAQEVFTLTLESDTVFS